MDQLLTDMVPFSGDTEILLHWENFSNLASNSLHRLFSRLLSDDSWREGICYKNLEGILLSDLMDTPHVGVLRKNQIIEELNEVFQSL